MSINNPLVIINTLTAANIQLQNTIDDLKYNLKSCEERIAKLSIDKNKRIKELESELAKEEPIDRFAMGTPDVAHAGENKEDSTKNSDVVAYLQNLEDTGFFKDGE